MIYWRIRQPRKMWRNWSEGIASDTEEAKIAALETVLDFEGKILPWANGSTVEMFECRDLEDYRMSQKEVDKYAAGEVANELEIST